MNFFERKKSFALLFILASMLGCKDPFDPKTKEPETGFLVIEGYINVGTNAVTKITLSRTNKISKSRIIDKELLALVAIEDGEGNQYSLNRDEAGTYVSDALSLPVNGQYRVSIRTTKGEQYFSQYMQPIVSPEIDSLTWRRVPDGVDIYVSTHDNQNQVHYYQWDYEEIWEIQSPYLSFYKYTPNGISDRPEDEVQMFLRCWKYEYPTNL